MYAAAPTALTCKVCPTVTIDAISEKNISILDRLSAGILILWFGVALLRFIFRPVITIFFTDIAAWIAFSAPLLLSWLPRWLYEITDTDIIGPLRLWGAAATAGLLFCIASSFIATPKMETVLAQLASPDISEQQRESLSLARDRAQNFSMQFLCIRAALAAGMALGLKKLPRKAVSVSESL